MARIGMIGFFGEMHAFTFPQRCFALRQLVLFVLIQRLKKGYLMSFFIDRNVETNADDAADGNVGGDLQKQYKSLFGCDKACTKAWLPP